MDLSIIIVNWNSAAYTLACLDSIRATTRGFCYEIIVVDNASADDSAQKLKLIPHIRLVVAHENLGFARANNLGYQHSSGAVLLFLNPDTCVQERAINLMREALLSSPHIGILGCRLLNSDLSLQTSCVLPFPTLLNQLTDVEALKLRFPGVRLWGMSTLFRKDTHLASVEAVSGACLMIRRRVFEHVGLFSSDYFMYCEDVDLCYKVARAGYQTVYAADASVIHHGGQSSKKTRESSFADVMGREAVRIFLSKWRGRPYARLYTYSMLLSALVRLAVLGIVPPNLLGMDSETVTSSRRKWIGILRWGFGRERWAKELGREVKKAAQPTIARMT